AARSATSSRGMTLLAAQLLRPAFAPAFAPAGHGRAGFTRMRSGGRGLGQPLWTTVRSRLWDGMLDRWLGTGGTRSALSRADSSVRYGSTRVG
ncbi:MAG: hypothetical protein ACRDPR_15190, partial [Nocardioidaceae bacterium]